VEHLEQQYSSADDVEQVTSWRGLLRRTRTSPCVAHRLALRTALYNCILCVSHVCFILWIHCLSPRSLPQIWVYGNSLESTLVAVVVPKKAFKDKHGDLASDEARKAMLEVSGSAC
jgi:hypothetical protein